MTHDEKINHVRGVIESIERTQFDHPCKHGHFDCATYEGGKCMDEELHRLEAQLDHLEATKPAIRQTTSQKLRRLAAFIELKAEQLRMVEAGDKTFTPIDRDQLLESLHNAFWLAVADVMDDLKR